VVGQLPVRKESYEGLALQLVTYAGTDRPLDQDSRDAELQLRATPEQLRAAFAKWVRPRDLVRIIVAPAGK
jgi:zinc protease